MGEDDERRATQLASDAPGADEVSTMPWPLLLRQRVTDRVESSERYPWLILATVLSGVFAVGCTITILAISVPSIALDLDSDDNTLSWVTTGPVLAFAVFGPVAGKLADLRGQRKAYLASLTGAAVFAGLAAMAPTAGALIAARVCGAAIGAAAGPASLALINRLFPPERRAQALGYWAMVGAGGPVIGGVIGAPVVETVGWRWIFIAQAPLMLLCAGVAAVVLPTLPPLHHEGPEGADTPAPTLDIAGALALGLGCVALLLAVNRGPIWGWSNPTVVAGFVLAVALVALFIVIEGRVAHPLLPLHYLRRRNFAFPIASQFFTNFAYMGAFAVTPLLLQHEFGYTPTHATWLSIPRPLIFAIAGPIAGYCTLRVGERSAGVFGAGAIALSMVALSSIGPGSSDLVVIGAVALSGLGMGTSSPALAASIANAVSDRDLGIAGATQQMVNQVGVAVGIQVMLAVQTGRAAADGGVAAYGTAYLVGGAMAAIGLVLALFVRSTNRRDRSRVATPITPTPTTPTPPTSEVLVPAP